MGGGERLHGPARALGDLGEGLAAGDPDEVRGVAPLLVRRGEAGGDLLAREPLPLPERHLAERRIDLDREAVGLRDELRRGAGALERARVDRRDDLGGERARDGLALAQALGLERDVARAGEAPLARPRGLPVAYDEQPELAHNPSIVSPAARKT